MAKRAAILVLLSTFFVASCGHPTHPSEPSTAKTTYTIPDKPAQTPGDDPTPPENTTADVLRPMQPATNANGQAEQSKNTDAKDNAAAPAKKPAKPAAKKAANNTKHNVNYWNKLPKFAKPGKNIVLTFDDGPSPTTATLIDALNKANVPAVMFWNTYHLNYANSTVVSLLNNSPNIMVGDHTVNHPNLFHLNEAKQQHEIVDAQTAIANKTGKPVLFFRPPYGNYNVITEDIVKKANMSFVMWDDDSLDWKYNSNEAAILAQIRSELHPGAVILLHDHAYTAKFVPDIIAMIRAKGYGFTTFAVPSDSAGTDTSADSHS